MRVIVVGLGGAGAMAAWRLADAGHDVVALEQFALDHDRGSSYGDSRIVRRVYPDPFYTRLMSDAYDLWARLMRDSGDDRLFVQCGGLFFGPAESRDMIVAEASLRDSGVAFEPLDAQACARRFPAIRLQAGEVGLFEPSMGYARASLAVRAAVRLAALRGAQIRENTSVGGIEAGGGGVRVRLAAGDLIEGDHILLAAGPWTRGLLEPLGVRIPLTVTRQPYLHLDPVAGREDFMPGKFPVWIDAGSNTYGFPILGDVPGVKIGIHDFGRSSDPETVDRNLTDQDRAAALAYAAMHFPTLGSAICYEKVCLYTVTPDSDFVVDTVPGHANLSFMSACSGHGFKFTPLLGHIAVETLGGRAANYDLSRFRASRFAGND